MAKKKALPLPVQEVELVADAELELEPAPVLDPALVHEEVIPEAIEGFITAFSSGASPSPSDPDSDWSTASMTAEEARARHEARKPDISHLESAIDWNAPDEPGGVRFLPTVGSYVVCERPSLLLPGKPWFETRVFRLTAAPEADGRVVLWDPLRHRHVILNWIQGLLEGFDWRLPPRGVNPATLLESDGKRRRRVKQVAKALRAEDLVDDGEGGTIPRVEKKRRGRPPGSKNRPAEERAAASAERAAKLTKRGKRR